MLDEFDTLKFESCACKTGWRKGAFDRKGKREENVADGLTKHVDRQKMEQYMRACGMVRRSGRHELSPQLGDSASSLSGVLSKRVLETPCLNVLV